MYQKLSDDLNQFVNHLGRIYEHIGYEYPQILQELDEEFQSSSLILDSLRHFQEQAEGQDIAEDDDDLVKRKKGLKHKEEEFLLLMEETSGHLEKLTATLETLFNLSGNVRRIQELSEEIEVISLNSMIMALKAGSEGGGFSVITENLRGLSSDTIAKTEHLNDLGKQIKDHFERARKSAGDIQQQQKAIIDQFRAVVDSNMETLEEETALSIRFFDQLKGGLKELKPYLYTIMEDVQHHDIIRQSIDHVVLSLDEIAVADFESVEDELNHYTFGSLVVEICISLLEDIRNKLSGYLQSLGEKVESLHDVVVDMEREQSEQIDAYRQESMRESGVGAKVQSLLDRISEVSLLRAEIAPQGMSIMKKAKEIKKRLRDLAKANQVFKNITVASRIEVAKIRILTTVQNSVKEMGEVTEEMEKEIEASFATIETFFEEMAPRLEAYEAYLHREEQFFDEFRRTVTESSEELNEVKQRISGLIKQFESFARKFLNLFSQSKKEIDEFDILLKTVEGIMADMTDLKKDMDGKRQRLLDQTGREDWEIQDQRLKDIIGKFTIFTHKKAALKKSGIDIEDTSLDEGEITLF